MLLFYHIIASTDFWTATLAKPQDNKMASSNNKTFEFFVLLASLNDFFLKVGILNFAVRWVSGSIQLANEKLVSLPRDGNEIQKIAGGLLFPTSFITLRMLFF